jgi:hypothetical protein
MLFQSYTSGCLAEFVHSLKGKASQDPLGETEDANKRKRYEVIVKDYDNKSDASDSPKFDVDDFFDSNDEAVDEGINKDTSYNSSYGTEETDVTMTEDANNCYTAKADESEEPAQQAYDAAKLDEFREAIRKYKALCYEDICLWIVQNSKQGERDLLAIKVSLRHHKGVDNKPKLYVTPCVLSLN